MNAVIQQRALELGFDDCRFTTAAANPSASATAAKAKIDADKPKRRARIMTTSRCASGRARCRVASAETAAVRRAVSAAPSSTAAGCCVTGSNQT